MGANPIRRVLSFLALVLLSGCNAELQPAEHRGPDGIRMRIPAGYSEFTTGAACVGTESRLSAVGPEICISLRPREVVARLFVTDTASMHPCADCTSYEALQVDTLHALPGTRLLYRARESGGYAHATRAPVWALVVSLDDDSFAVLTGRGAVGPRRRVTLEAIAATVRREGPAT